MSQIAYWEPGSTSETALTLTLADVCRFLVSDWLPTLPIAASRSVLGWPYFLMRAASGTAGSTYWTIEPIAGWSERQWKGVLSWMLGVVGTRRMLAEDGYRWIAPVSAFYPTRNRPVAIPAWPLAYPPSILEIGADPQNKSRLRPDYIAIRLQSGTNLEFALVESKGTSRCLSNMLSCPPDWAQQARNGRVTVTGTQLNIPRDSSGKAVFANAAIENKGLLAHEIAENRLSGLTSRHIGDIFKRTSGGYVYGKGARYHSDH